MTVFLRACVFLYGDPQKCLQRMREDLQPRNKRRLWLLTDNLTYLSTQCPVLILFYGFCIRIDRVELGIDNLLKVRTVTSLEPQALP